MQGIAREKGRRFHTVLQQPVQAAAEQGHVNINLNDWFTLRRTVSAQYPSNRQEK
jgi:hypothetical protein